MARPKKKGKELPAMATMVYSTADAALDKPILKSDAERLFNEGKIERLLGIVSNRDCYAMPRTTEQIIRNELPSFSIEVLRCISKAYDILKKT